ncbi:uncharacterized protein LTR77_009890 [Saxophila tyrrhenica]|uniref:DUF7730 domain-containing protein n=1 Tax=Saxophila tyrrhenica TaxID=1690608 RepID=A0AAV9NXJ4_9PEZI|nr:hypothetical protein LTR77_009890 [Saxophila tyrrhenica]
MAGSKRKRDSTTDEPAKKKKWTGRILNTAKLLAANAPSPPPSPPPGAPKPKPTLLTLPPEIRNRIWEFALSEGILHAGCGPEWPAPVGMLICNAQRGEDDAMQTVKYGETTADVESYDQRHSRCTDGGRWVTLNTPPDIRRRYSVALLETCRQVHSEAALLPFELNTFVFTYPLKREQRS